MSIGPLAAKYGVPYLVEYKGEEWAGVRYKLTRMFTSANADSLIDTADTTSWVFLAKGDNSEVTFQQEPEARGEDFGEITPLVPARSITRADLPTWAEVETLVEQAPWDTSTVDVVLDAVVAHLNERGGVPAERGESCCERARLLDNELARRNEELSEAEDEITLQKERAVKAEAERDDYKALVLPARRERDELKRKLDAAEVELNAVVADRDARAEQAANRPTLDREAVEDALGAFTLYGNLSDATDAIMELAPAEGWPEWLGPKIDPGDFEVTRDSMGVILVDGEAWASADATPESLRDIDPICGIKGRARAEAMARFIESEQAATDDINQRIEKAAEKLWLADRTGEVSWNELHVDMQCRYRDEAARLLDAGWTPPESEASQ